ncbi:type II toxin-antitoxin system VapB family antitoxin [Patescibacteria group bacterium]|nr:type II toxin-antitoxin system VapB family antitoxin [Patescibacteria group bacterium]
MKRKNLILDEDLIAMAKKLSKEKTITSTIHFTLQYYINDMESKKKLGFIRSLKGKDIWEGNLSELRKKRI